MKKSNTTLKTYLSEKLNAAGIFLNPSQLDQLWIFHNYLRERNDELNLTRIHNFESMVRKHYVDCLIVINIFQKHNIPFPSPTIDLGSGPGFPGIPLAVAMPDHSFILSEGRKQRVEYLHEAVKKIGLANADVFGKNIQTSTELTAEAVITRAVETMYNTAVRCSQILKAGGLLIFMKGPNCDEEISELLSLENPACELMFDERYFLPDSQDERRLVVFKVIKNIFREKETEMGAKLREQHITSEDNKIFKTLKTLNSGRMIKKHGQSILCGKKIIQELLNSDFQKNISALLFSEKKRDEFFRHIRIPENFALNIFTFPAELFQQIDFSGCGDFALLINVPEIPEWIDDEKGITLFFPFSDPENLGAAFRSAAAFDFNRVVLLEESANPYHGKTIRASAGEQFHLSFSKGPSIKNLKTRLPLFALDMNGEDIANISWPENFGLLTGMEGTGIPEGLDIIKIKIPVSRNIESLNASVALGIALYEIRKSIQRRST